MSRLNTIQYDAEKMDFIINGIPLLNHLQKHEGIIPENYIPAILSQSGVSSRLLGESEPDLADDHIAIYLCGYCGGYDGAPIGVKVIFDDDVAHWDEIGHYSDFEDATPIPFKRIRGYTFSREEYVKVIKQIEIYEPNVSN